MATKERVERAGAAGEKSEMKKIGELETMKWQMGCPFMVIQFSCFGQISKF